jgi:hypothetical protein
MKYFLSFILICITISVFSQTKKPITKGNFTLGGNIGFYSENNSFKTTTYFNGVPHDGGEKMKSYSLTLSPSFGYFIIDGLLIGLSPEFSFSSTSQNGGEYLYKNFSFSFEPYIKYYFKNCLFVGIESGYQYSTSFIKGTENRTTYNSYFIHPLVGYAIFLNDKVSVEPSLVYAISKTIGESSQFESDNQYNNLYFTVGFHFFL